MRNLKSSLGNPAQIFVKQKLMAGKLLNFQESIGGAAIIVAVFSILSKFLGLLRDRLLAVHFGAGEILDAYWAAFRLPNLVFNTLVLGAFSSAFIPVFLNYYLKDRNKAWRATNSILNIFFLIVLFLSTLIIIFAPVIIPIIVPGFSQATKNLTVSFTRIITLSILFFTLSNVASSLLNSFRKFLAYSLAPLMYNLGILLGILFLTKTRLGIYGLAWGVVLGSFLHLIVQLPAVIKIGYRFKFLISFSSGVKEVICLMLPRFFGLAVEQINLLATTLIASLIGVGAIAIYNLSFNLNSLPIGMIGIPLSISLFPILSGYYSQNQQSAFNKKLTQTVAQIFYFIIPLTIVYFLFKEEIVRIILEAGLWGYQDSLITAQALGFFSLSLFAQSSIPVLAKAFYAQHNTKIPVLSAVIGFSVNITGCLILGRLIGIVGLALAFSLAAIINFSLLYFFLGKTNFNFQKKEINLSFLKFTFFSLVVGLLMFGLKALTNPLIDSASLCQILLQSAIIILIGLLVYFFITLICKAKEAQRIWRIIRG